MDDAQKDMIRIMCFKGQGYGTIAKQLGMDADRVQDYQRQRAVQPDDTGVHGRSDRHGHHKVDQPICTKHCELPELHPGTEIKKYRDLLQQQIVDKASHNQDYEDIAQEIFRLRAQKERSLMNDTSRTEFLARINELEEFITSHPSEITEFDENLVKRLLAKETIYEEKMVFEFKSGVSVDVKTE